jgi:hypothetical protein
MTGTRFNTTLFGGVDDTPCTPRSEKNRGRILIQEFPLAGFQYHRAAGVWSFLREGETLRLRRERHNRHDPNAVAVWFRNDKLGYLPRRENTPFARMLDRGLRLEGRIVCLRDHTDPWRRIRFSVALLS